MNKSTRNVLHITMNNGVGISTSIKTSSHMHPWSEIQFDFCQYNYSNLMTYVNTCTAPSACIGNFHAPMDTISRNVLQSEDQSSFSQQRWFGYCHQRSATHKMHPLIQYTSHRTLVSPFNVYHFHSCPSLRYSILNVLTNILMFGFPMVSIAYIDLEYPRSTCSQGRDSSPQHQESPVTAH